ncbi:MAG TPA: DUF6328 family protein [Thermoanaerobaculia bacterium]|nr:DUF6328 family protein [Thermoanaerobaculia bacterium]
MAQLQAKIQNVLDEIRILILSTQVLLSFQYYAAFEHGFLELPRALQLAKLAALILSLLTLALLLTPVSFHRVVEDGYPTRAMYRFATRMLTPALLPFGVALAIDIFVAAWLTSGRAIAWTFGIGIVAFATFSWWGGEAIAKRRHGPAGHGGGGDEDESDDEDEHETRHRVQQVLTEARVVLPGAQAIFGFGFSAVLSEAFHSLPESSKIAHLGALVFVTLSIVLLVTPAAYHRIVEEGENTEHFVRFAGKVITAAMVPLALGISLDFFVVTRKILGSFAAGAAGGVATLIVFFGMWFGYTLAKRLLRQREHRPNR